MLKKKATKTKKFYGKVYKLLYSGSEYVVKSKASQLQKNHPTWGVRVIDLRVPSDRNQPQTFAVYYRKV